MTIASVVSSRSKEAERSGMSSQNSVELSIPAKVEFIRLGRLDQRLEPGHHGRWRADR